MRNLKSYKVFEQEVAEDYENFKPEATSEKTPDPIPNQAATSEEEIIQKIQAGDYAGAKSLVQQLAASADGSNREEVNGRLRSVSDYISKLDPEKQKAIKDAISEAKV